MVNFEFSKLELWYKDVLYDPRGGLRNKDWCINGFSVIKWYERKWYNPLRYILAKNGVMNIKKENF